MLGKLLKYELIATGRRIPLLYGVLLAVSLLFGIIIGSGASDNIVVGRITTLLYVMAAVTLGLLTLIVLIQRFYKNLLGNEGYLMFTLPAGPGAHVASKIISAAIWIFLAGITGLMALSIMLYFISHGEAYWFWSWGGIGDMFRTVTSVHGGVLLIIEIIVLVILVCAEAATKVYAAIAIGHQWSGHRALGAVLAYVGISIIESIVATPLQNLFDDNELTYVLYSTTASEAMHAAQTFVLALIALVGALLAIYWFVTWILVKKRLNLQ